jgi:hypothetical protein
MDEPVNATPPPAAYVNFLQVASGRAEFFLAFGQLVQGETAQGHLVSRLVTSPLHAKAMLEALTEAVERFEERFGEIPALERAAGSAVESPRGSQATAAPRKRVRRRR